jgi:hypothetical protein
MVDIYGRSARGKTQQQGDLSKYATLDQLRSEIDDLLNITSVDQNEVVVFQDKQGRLKTSNIQLPDVLVRIPTAVTDNIVTFTDQGKIQDSGKSVNDYVRKAGDVFSGDIIMNKNKITDLGNPTSDSDVATKKYVDDQESKYILANGAIMRAFLNMNNNGINNLRKPESEFDAVNKKYVDDKDVPINNEITALKNEFMSHVNTFLSFRRNINTLKNDFFGNPSNVDITLANINKKTNLIKIPHNQIKNIVYTVTSGVGMWTPENNTIKHTAEITGIYKMSVLSVADFRISTTNPSTGNSFKTISVLLDKDSEVTFTLASSSRNLPQAYWWCLEFVAQLT